MQKLLRELFRELADIPHEERQRILAERRVPVEVRAELESLLSHDAPADESLTRIVSEAAGQVLHSGHNLLRNTSGAIESCVCSAPAAWELSIWQNAMMARSNRK